MKVFIRCIVLVGICLMLAGVLQSETRVSGDLTQFGDWGDVDPPDTTHYVYVIDGDSWVPADKTLTIHAGVTVRVEWRLPIRVEGGFQAMGEAWAPIIVEADTGAQCFLFLAGAADDTVRLNHVHFDPEALPSRALTSKGRPLDINDCMIGARRTALECTGAPVWMKNSTITKSRAAGSAIFLVRASNSIVNDNNIIVSVLGTNHTSCLHIQDSQNLLIEHNEFRIDGQGSITGIYAKNNCDNLLIKRNVIRAESRGYWARGIWIRADDSHDYTIENCTLHIISENSERSAILLWGRAYAEIVNSILWLDGNAGGSFVATDCLATPSIDYCDLWQELYGTSSLNDDKGVGQTLDGRLDDEGNFNMDPLFVGVVGEEPFSYELQNNSPCIDAGDPNVGAPRDPDGTVADVGAYYFQSAAADPNPNVPTDISVGAAYPNPFNMSTVLPLELYRSATVEIAVFNMLGQEVGRIFYGKHAAGKHLLSVSGSSWASGVYFAQILVDRHSISTQRLVLIK